MKVDEEVTIQSQSAPELGVVQEALKRKEWIFKRRLIQFRDSPFLFSWGLPHLIRRLVLG